MKASEKTVDLVRRYYASLESTMRMDEVIRDFFTEDARLRFANYEPVVGREAIHDALSGILDSVNGVRHEVKGVWEDEGDALIYEVDVTFIRRDDREVTLPGAAFCVMEDGLFQEQRLYVDITPVFAEMGEV